MNNSIFKRLHRIVCLIFFCLLIINGTVKGSDLLSFKHLTRDNGLSSNRVNFITGDSLGFIWFATEDGLNKFDGINIEVYRNITDNYGNKIDNSVDFILEDITKNNFWLATSSGLIYFDRIHNKFEKVVGAELQDSATGNIRITSLCFDKNQNLWIGAYSGLFIYDITKDTLNRVNYLQKTTSDLQKIDNIFTVYKDTYNEMWIGCESGLFKYCDSTNTLIKYFSEINLKSVQVIKQDSKKDFWIGSDFSGLYYIKSHPDKGITREFSKKNGDFVIDRIHGFIEDEPGKYYILVRDGGLYYYNKVLDSMQYLKSDIYNNSSINSTALISGYKSSNGFIWFGTYNSGVNYIDKNKKKFAHYKVNFKDDGLFNNNIRALYEDSQGYLWIGTKEGGGLSRFDKKTATFINYKKGFKTGELRDDYVFSICELDRNRLLIGTFRKGLAIFNKRTGTFKHYVSNDKYNKSISDNRVYSIYKDLQANFWVGNYINLQKLNIKNMEFTTVEGIISPRCFCDEGEDKLWIGSKGHGLYLYNKISGRFINYLHNANDSTSLSSNDIFSLEKDSEGYLWIATKLGINRFDPEKNEFISYTENDGLQANWICGLLIDDNNIWVSTLNGISKFDINKNQFKNYDIKDGLQGNEFEGYVACKTADGQMLFGGRNGFNIFLPEEIIDNTKIPKIVITGFKLFNKYPTIGNKKSLLKKNISFTDNIYLKHYQSDISFDFTSLNYTSPEKNHFKYKLIGFDDDWIDAGISRIAIYTNIPPESYTFKVIGSNNDNYWNTDGTSVKIIIASPFWKTKWALLIYIFILSLLSFIIRQILVFRIQQQNLLKFERLEKNRIQELNKRKLQFFTNIAHEFRTPLTLIAEPLKKLSTHFTKNEEQKYLFNIVQNNVHRLLNLVNELMDFRRIENSKFTLHISKSNIADFVKNSIICFEDRAKEKQIDFRFECNILELASVWFDKNIIDKVLFNIVSNAFKYTPTGGKIVVSLAVEQNEAVISIADSGKGIPKDKLESIFERFYQIEDDNYDATYGTGTGTGIGLAFSKKLMEIHKGSIHVKSEQELGSTFTMRFFIEKANYTQDEIVDDKTFLPEFRLKNNQPNRIWNNDIVDKPLRSENILIVEDNSELRNFLENHFNDFNVYTAANGKEGYKIANAKIPDIIISDIMMPELNGLEMCKKLKMQFATSHIPVILLTAKSETIQKIEGIETGADAYIEKPFDINYLEAIINNIIKQRKKLKKKYTENYDNDNPDSKLTIHEKKFIEKIKSIIKLNLSNTEFSVDTFGSELGLSRSQLFRKFKIIYELTPSEFIRNERLKHAKQLLQERNYNVNEIADLTGFKSASYFITSFKKFYGKTPNTFIDSKK